MIAHLHHGTPPGPFRTEAVPAGFRADTLRIYALYASRWHRVISQDGHPKIQHRNTTIRVSLTAGRIIKAGR